MKHAPGMVLVFALTLAILHGGSQGGDMPRLSPANQPLAVVRAADTAVFQSLLETRQAKALGLEKKEYSGRIPGVGADIKSLQTFLAALAAGGARNFWYCLSQQGSSLARQTGAMGWDAPDAAPDAPLSRRAASLGQMGLDTSGLKLESRALTPDLTRIILYPDDDAYREVFAGDDKDDGGWRGSLAAFLAGGDIGDGDSLGIWVNTRPVLGMLSLFAGPDIRAMLRTRAMNAPVRASLELMNRRGDLGVEVSVNNIFPHGAADGERVPLLIRSRGAPLLELNIPVDTGLWERFGPDNKALLLANIDISSLVPKTIALTFAPGGDGGLAWSMACLMPDKERFIMHMKRVRAWLEALSSAPSPVVGIEDAVSPRGDALWKIRAGDMSLVMGTADIDAAGGDSALLILAPTPEDWPDPAGLDIAPGDAPCLAQWRTRFDPASRAAVAGRLALLSGRRGAEELSARFWDAMLPDEDAGRVAVEGDSVVVRADSILLPLLIPELAEVFRGKAAAVRRILSFPNSLP